MLAASTERKNAFAKGENMNTEEVKKLVKEQYGKELTDEEAKELLTKVNAEGELSEEDLENVSGGSRNIPWKEHVHV